MNMGVLDGKHLFSVTKNYTSLKMNRYLYSNTLQCYSTVGIFITYNPFWGSYDGDFEKSNERCIIEEHQRCSIHTGSYNIY